MGRKLINWNDERAVKWARHHEVSPTRAPLFDMLDGVGHYLAGKGI